MKHFFKILLLLLFYSGQAQNTITKDSKLNNLKDNDIETIFLELKSPLNLVQCKNCISENPIIDLKELNDDSKFKQVLNDVINLNSIAFNLTIDKEGRIIEFKPNYAYSNFINKVSESRLNNLNSLIKNKKILMIPDGNDNFYKTTLLFVIENNKISLNSVLH